MASCDGEESSCDARWEPDVASCDGEELSCLDDGTNDDNGEDTVDDDEEDEVDAELDFENQENNVAIFSCRIHRNASK